MSVIEKAIAWALGIADDPTHGYDQTRRWGPDYDCSSLVIQAFKEAGLPLTATYTGNMKYDFLRNGFADASTLNVVELNMGAGLKRGDVLLNELHHCAIYLGDGRVVQASSNERGGITGGVSGDQTGGEIGLSWYRNYPWDIVLRYVGEEIEPEDETDPVFNLDTNPIRRGEKGDRVKRLQALLIYFHGISCGPDGVDGDFGANTERAVREFQDLVGAGVDGIVGSITGGYLLEVEL